jgi:hypothetical protein
MTEAGLIAQGGYVEKPYISYDTKGIKSIYIDALPHKNFVPLKYTQNNVTSGVIVSDAFKHGDY